MQSSFLKFIWHKGRFNKASLCTQQGQQVVILHPGMPNRKEGPDFLRARISIGGTIWIGNIVVHHDGDDWYRRGLDREKDYSNIILHVVFRNTRKIYSASGQMVPTLELNGKIPVDLIENWKALQSHRSTMACEGMVGRIPGNGLRMLRASMAEEYFNAEFERLIQQLTISGMDWDAVLFHRTVKNLGHPDAAPFFERLSEIIDHKAIQNHYSDLFSVEALVFGQAGLLKGELRDEYPRHLQRRFLDLKASMNIGELDAAILPRDIQARKRVIRQLSLLAVFVHRYQPLFGQLIDHQAPGDIIRELRPSDYWLTHDDLDITAVESEQHDESPSWTTFLAVVYAPMLYAYGKYMSVAELEEEAIRLTKDLPQFENANTKCAKAIGMLGSSAYDSLAADHLVGEYCRQRKCLQCPLADILLNGRTKQGQAGPVLGLVEINYN